MNTSSQITKHFRDVLFGGNWTSVNLKETLADISWQQATKKVYSFNTIAILVYHMNYYVGVVTRVLQGQPLDGKDSDSFNCPPIESAEDWEKLVRKTWTEAESFASLIEQLPESKLEEIFINDKYGNYYRNLHGVIEHYHYHLGQIVIIKKIIASSATC